MTNKPPRFIWRWCWKVISPVTIFIVLAMSIKRMSESTAQYKKWDGEKVTIKNKDYTFSGIRLASTSLKVVVWLV